MRGGFGRRRAAIGAVLAVTALAVSCGGEDEGSSGAAGGQSGDQNPPPSAAHVEAVDNSFEPQTLKIPTGRPVSVHLENTGSSRHTFTVPALNVSVTLEPGAEEIVKLDVPNRETEFICEFHGSGGMTGTIVPQ
jgi:plastocyanin